MVIDPLAQKLPGEMLSVRDYLVYLEAHARVLLSAELKLKLFLSLVGEVQSMTPAHGLYNALCRADAKWQVLASSFATLEVGEFLTGLDAFMPRWGRVLSGYESDDVLDSASSGYSDGTPDARGTPFDHLRDSFLRPRTL